MRWLIAITAVLWVQAALAQGQFSEIWAPICTMGQDASAGCDEIRDREILDATAMPWRSIGRVNFSSRSQRSHCTGVLIAEQLVLTAAHCLYNSARKRWISPSSIRFAAGYQRGEAVAVSAVKAYRLDPEQGVSGAFDNRADLDWAVLELIDPIGAELGFLSLAADANVGFVSGYAGLRPHVQSRTELCAPQPVGQELLRAICPVMMGDSGAPLLVETDRGPEVAGILSRIAPTPDGIDALFLSVQAFDLKGD